MSEGMSFPKLPHLYGQPRQDKQVRSVIARTPARGESSHHINVHARIVWNYQYLWCMKLRCWLPHLATQTGGGGNFRSFLPWGGWAPLKVSEEPWKPQDECGVITGCSPNWGLFRNTRQKESQQPKPTHFLIWVNLFYPRLTVVNHTLTSNILLSSHQSHPISR